jgi:iron complex transport system permease protein
MLAGDAFLRTGDVVNWINGRSGRTVTYVLDQRFPRVVSAVPCGAALAIAGTTVQAVCRNPLAEPGILGITGGAGVGAVITLVLLPSASIWSLSGVAAVGALGTFMLVSWRGGLSSDRLVLIGVGVSSGATAIMTLLIVATDPWNLSMAMTWLSGSTYGRTLPQVAILVSVADSLGRTLLAPAQIPAGLLAALIGAPYFVCLLWRTRVPNR